MRLLHPGDAARLQGPVGGEPRPSEEDIRWPCPAPSAAARATEHRQRGAVDGEKIQSDSAPPAPAREAEITRHTAENWLGRSVSGGRTTASSRAKVTTSTRSGCPGRWTCRPCATRWPMPDQLDRHLGRGALPRVVAVVTGELLAQHNLAWMPTLSGDTQAVLATDKVRMQGQEVACVIAEDPYVAHDALELIEVDYDPLPVVITPQQSLEPGAPVIRDDKEESRTTASTTGRPATPRPPTGPSPRPTGWSASTPSTPAATRRRWRPAAAWPTSTRSPARPPST